MNYTYDPEADALYINVTPGVATRQVERSDGVVVDLDASGSPIGFDIMNPDAEWNPWGLVTEYKLAAADSELLIALARRRWHMSVDVATGDASRSGARASLLPA